MSKSIKKKNNTNEINKTQKQNNLLNVKNITIIVAIIFGSGGLCAGGYFIHKIAYDLGRLDTLKEIINEGNMDNFSKIISKPYNILEEQFPSYHIEGDDIPFILDSIISPHSFPYCVRIEYKNGSKKWGGVQWQNIINNYGEYAGVNLNKCNYKKCTFWAKGEEGNEIIEIICGGIKNLRFNFRDSFRVKKIFSITKYWQQYELYLDNVDFSCVIGGFCCIIRSNVNPKGAVFYLDDIKYE